MYLLFLFCECLSGLQYISVPCYHVHIVHLETEGLSFDLLELELQMTLSHHVGAENFCKSNTSS